ncbi:MAG TPA: hypothetical protein PLN85_00985 [archaeon]|jgi:hypothetical protein|nr:hypothetical protein [archaeon]
MWEYNRFTKEIIKISDLIDFMNELGSNNWEIIYYNETKEKKINSPYIITIIAKKIK